MIASGIVRALLAAFLLGSMGCTQYEYEEEVYLESDGSGSIRVSGSKEILGALYDIDLAGTNPLETSFEGEGLDLVSVRETEHGGRPFVHMLARFSDWNRLCHHPLFRERTCRLERGKRESRLEQSLPASTGKLPARIDPRSLVTLRIHFPGAIHDHNAPGEIERGNILSWTRPVREHFGGEPVVARAVFDRRSVLAATAQILLSAVGLVVLSIAVAIYLMVRKGRRQLEADQH